MKLRAVLTGSALALAAITAATAEQLQVQVYDAQVRANKSAMSKVVATVDFGDKVDAEKVAAGKGEPVWFLVSKTPEGPVKGYLSGNSLTLAGKTKSSGQTLTKGAGDPEVTAALKRLGDTHSAAAAAAAGGADYGAVDWLESKTVQAKALRDPAGRWYKFRSDGKLGEFGRWGASQQ